MKQPVIKKFNYGSFKESSINDLSINDRDKYLLSNFPTVYIIQDSKNNSKTDYTVYVGETTNIVRRTSQHLNADIRNGRDDWEKFGKSPSAEMYVISHNYFNKSLTLDIENRLMHYLSSVDAINSVNNRRFNQQNDYYTAEYLDTIFSKIWKKLHQLNKTLFPSETLIKDSALFKASPFHKLTPEQIKAKNAIILKIISNLGQKKEEQLILVEGEAGSGKTVLMSSLLYDLFNDEDFNVSKNNLSVHLLVNHNEQLTVYQQLANKLGLKNIDHTDVVSKPTSFINKSQKNKRKADIVIIDEAHLLLTRGKQSYQGKNHLRDILKYARVVIAVFDEKQILTTEQIWDSEDLLEIKHQALQDGNHIYLQNQLRINATEDTINWIRSFVDQGDIKPIPRDQTYDFKVFTSVTDMYHHIQTKSHDESKGISRLLATFDWNYSSNKPTDSSYWNVTIGDFSLPWNLQLPKPRRTSHLSWAEQPQTIGEVGSTFTIQGFDLNYAAVIIGPSVKYRNGKVIFDPTESKNKKATSNRTMKDGSKQKFGEILLRNELNVLLTRGVNGLYLYAVDPDLQEALLAAQNHKAIN